MKRTLVIGIGNLLQKDDGIGVKVVSALVDSLKEHGITAFIGETDVPFCLAEIREDDFLVIVDAMVGDGETGKVEQIAFGEAWQGGEYSRFSHEYSLLDAIYLTYPKIQGCLIAIEGADFSCGLGLSDPLQQHFNVICKKVLRGILKQKGAVRRK